MTHYLNLPKTKQNTKVDSSWTVTAGADLWCPHECTYTHISLAHGLISLKQQGPTLAEGGCRRARLLSSSSLPIIAPGSHCWDSFVCSSSDPKAKLCENSREERGRMASLSGLAQAFFRPQKTHHHIQPCHPAPWHLAASREEPGGASGKRQGGWECWTVVWYGGQTQRDRERRRRRKGEGEGHPTHMSRMEVVEDIETLKSPFRSFSSSC